MQSLLYLKIRCVEHRFRSPHLPALVAMSFACRLAAYGISHQGAGLPRDRRGG